MLGKVLAFVITALTVGVIHTFAKPQLDNLVPENLKSNWVTQSFFTGAFIIVALVAATTILRMLHVKKVAV